MKLLGYIAVFFGLVALGIGLLGTTREAPHMNVGPGQEQFSETRQMPGLIITGVAMAAVGVVLIVGARPRRASETAAAHGSVKASQSTTGRSGSSSSNIG